MKKEISPKKKIRINRFLAGAGLGSRREVESLILEGKIFVNNVLAEDFNIFIDPVEDSVSILKRGKKQKIHYFSDKKVYIMNKPAGVIVSRRDPKNPSLSVYKLLPKEFARFNAVGRLDLESTGLLLFCNDGELHYRLTHPKYEIERRYLVFLDKEITQEDLIRLRKGIVISGRKTAQVRVYFSKERKRTCEIILKEGRNREVRRLFEKINFQVKRLHRIEYGSIKLENLGPSQGRLLLQAEAKSLYKTVGLFHS